MAEYRNIISNLNQVGEDLQRIAVDIASRDLGVQVGQDFFILMRDYLNGQHDPAGDSTQLSAIARDFLPEDKNIIKMIESGTVEVRMSPDRFRGTLEDFRDRYGDADGQEMWDQSGPPADTAAQISSGGGKRKYRKKKRSKSRKKKRSKSKRRTRKSKSKRR